MSKKQVKAFFLRSKHIRTSEWTNVDKEHHSHFDIVEDETEEFDGDVGLFNRWLNKGG
jgi:hypothetical protein